MKKKVLVIDDFDRISEENQEGAYKLFNCLNGKLPIIFVGDYSKITKRESKYLQKIIDRKIELPISLYPMSIWEEYFEKLNKYLLINVSQRLINLFIEEHRNLRERSMFHCYVMQELIQKNKKDYVQINQQLAIIYLYLFYPLEYMKVIKGEDFNECVTAEKLNPIKEILNETDGYPKAFINNKQGYYLYEKVVKLKASEAISIIEGPKLKEEMLKNGNVDDDFYYFVSTKYNDLTTKQKERLLDTTLENIYEGKDSSLLYFIVLTKNNIKFQNEEKDDDAIRDYWLTILEKYNFDFSQKIHFLEDYLSISFFKLGKMYDGLDLNSKDFIEGKKKGHYFLTFLSMKNKWFNYDWDESYWKALESIFSQNHIDYLIVLKNLLVIDVDFITKEIIVYDELFNDLYNKPFDNVDKFSDKIKPNINKLRDENFNIKYENRRVVNISI
ncbi:hypothetical protein ACIL4L_002794 [Enterococcus faecalis]